MPFSMPSTYNSKANTGYGATFAIGSPPVAVLEVKSFNIDVINMPEVDKTHLLSPSNTREFAPGMIHPGKISLSGNYIGDSTQLTIITDAQAQTTFTYTIVASMQADAKTATITGLGYFTMLPKQPGADDSLLYLLAHPSEEAGEAAFRKMREDPKWVKIKEDSEK